MPKNKSVCFAYIAPGHVTQGFCDSILHTLNHHAQNSRKVIGAFVSIESGPRIAEARCAIVDQFAATNCDWLWMVDADMVWEPDALDRLLKIADPVTAPIVGGLCFGGRGGTEGTIFPTIYELGQDEIGVTTDVVTDYPKDEVIQVGATGAAFLLVHRSVFAKMKNAFGTLPNGRENPYPWFVEASNGGRPFGEDISFCIKALALDLPIFVDTSIKIGHRKSIELNETEYLRQTVPTPKLKEPLALP